MLSGNEISVVADEQKKGTRGKVPKKIVIACNSYFSPRLEVALECDVDSRVRAIDAVRVK